VVRVYVCGRNKREIETRAPKFDLSPASLSVLSSSTPPPPPSPFLSLCLSRCLPPCLLPAPPPSLSPPLSLSLALPRSPNILLSRYLSAALARFSFFISLSSRYSLPPPPLFPILFFSLFPLFSFFLFSFFPQCYSFFFNFLPLSRERSRSHSLPAPVLSAHGKAFCLCGFS
jgi:hypothetical protein